jgi:hypothetical protein
MIDNYEDVSAEISKLIGANVPQDAIIQGSNVAGHCKQFEGFVSQYNPLYVTYEHTAADVRTSAVLVISLGSVPAETVVTDEDGNDWSVGSVTTRVIWPLKDQSSIDINAARGLYAAVLNVGSLIEAKLKDTSVCRVLATKEEKAARAKA